MVISQEEYESLMEAKREAREFKILMLESSKNIGTEKMEVGFEEGVLLPMIKVIDEKLYDKINTKVEIEYKKSREERAE